MGFGIKDRRRLQNRRRFFYGCMTKNRHIDDI
jgi:hypothetical protein